jgi:predicted membrane metal-binding protein
MFDLLVHLVLIPALPAMFVGATGFVSWNRLARPKTFLCVALAALYAVYVSIFYLLPSHP